MKGTVCSGKVSWLYESPAADWTDWLLIGSFLDSGSPVLSVAAVTALGEVARNGLLLIPVEGEGFTKLSLVENLLARLPSGKESTKVQLNSPPASHWRMGDYGIYIVELQNAVSVC